jgi:hypothetical protein
MVGLRKIAPGRSKNVNEPAQLKYWRRGLHISPDQSRRAVEKVGNSATAVRKELEIAAPQMKAGPARGMPAVVGAGPARCRKLYEQELSICFGIGWVCDNHPDHAWHDELGCTCGAREPCQLQPGG